MKKMKSLFKKVYDAKGNFQAINEVTKGCEWVLNGEGKPTRKLDGTCCMIKNNEIYARFDYKKGRKLPEGAIPCQEKADEVTGHFPHWVKVENQPQYKWHKKALQAMLESGKEIEDGTYELIGPHFQGNPEKVEGEDKLVKHGVIELEDLPKRTFESIREFLEKNEIEGIVYHRGNGEMCKVKRIDFNIMWNNKLTK